MRLSFVLASLLISLLTGTAVLMLLLPAPQFYFFALGIFGLEWAPLALLMGLLGAGLALAGVRGPTGLARTLGWAGLALSLWTLLGGGALFWRALSAPIRARTTIEALRPIAPGGFSLAAFARGAPAGDGLTVRRDLAYATVGGQELRYDHYAPPPGPAPAPAVIVVHGGSWRSGDKGEFPGASIDLARQGYHVFDVAYRLAPGAPFPAAVGDVKCAIGVIKRQAAALGIDPGRIALLGRSAGAQIALLAAYAADQQDLPASCDAGDTSVAAVVAFYPPTDLAYDYVNRIKPELTVGALDSYIGGGPEQFADAYRLATPQTWIGPATPPTLLLHGERDQYVRLRDSQVLADALEQAGRPFGLVELPLANHGFDANFAGLSSQQTRPFVTAFLDATLRQPPAQ